MAGSYTVTAATSGAVTAPVFTANSTAGSYSVTAADNGNAHSDQVTIAVESPEF